MIIKYLGLNFLICSLIFLKFLLAANISILNNFFFTKIVSKVDFPIEPVEPRIAIFFLIVRF